MLNCATCGFKAPDSEHCRIFGHPINPQIDYCSQYNANPNECSVCGNPIVKHEILLEEDSKMLILCQSCIGTIGTCKTCHLGTVCAFEQDSSPTPQYVEKLVRRGNMTSVVRVPNIARIDITCKKGCSCFDLENGCIRQSNNFCEKYLLNKNLGHSIEIGNDKDVPI